MNDDYDRLLDRIDDAIETSMSSHEETDDVCSCGVRNNMDGDVLFSHRVGSVIDAVHAVLPKLWLEWSNDIAGTELGPLFKAHYSCAGRI
jgi:hypothetical protein